MEPKDSSINHDTARSFAIIFQSDSNGNDSIADHRANVEDIVFNNIRNADPEHLEHIIHEVFEEEGIINFEEILDEESSDEEVLSDDIGCASDQSKHDTDRVDKIVTSPEIRALNVHVKRCMIQCYYTTGDAYAVCVSCMINISDTDIDLMYLVANLAECLAWLQRCDECIERLEELCRAKRPRIVVGHRQLGARFTPVTKRKGRSTADVAPAIASLDTDTITDIIVDAVAATVSALIADVISTSSIAGAGASAAGATTPAARGWE
ncbi:hypothetical protein ALC60_12471 [Trachymyrmex zeteki]|uniref:Uncharacterized protein n=1 Tax=Mycetomoellerius zeteki TaxID=64791 RepID=A0A151WKV6_9HYME|nr:hypothetical protein ALC60_12471 [Trachymyrmex zeteki]